MAFETIIKDPGTFRVTPNLQDYERERDSGFWEQARAELDGLPGGRGLNIAHEAVDRHATGARADHLALRWLGRNGEVRDFTYADLGRQTSRFANVLHGLGLGKGDLVCVPRRAHPRALHRRARDAEEPQRLLPALLRVRPRADPHAARRSGRRRRS